MIRAKDTPNFIANRVGVFSMLATIHHAERLGIGFDVVDALTGSLIGRPRSATFRTADVVGLDTFAHVVNTMKEALPDDPWHRYYDVPAWLKELIAQGALGQKTRRGVYQKVGPDIQVLDLKTRSYRLSEQKADDAVVEILEEPQRGGALRAAARGERAAGAVPVVDLSRHLSLLRRASRRRSPTTRATSTSRYAGASAGTVARSRSGRRRAGSRLRNGSRPISQREERWRPRRCRPGRWSRRARACTDRKARTLPRTTSRSRVRRCRSTAASLSRDRVLGEEAKYGATIFETDGVRCWHTGDDIAIVSFKSRMHAIGDDVLDGVQRALDEAERNYMGLVIWQTEPPFSVGANLKKSPHGRGEAVAALRLGRLFTAVPARGGVARVEGGARSRRRRPADGGKARRSRAPGGAVPGDDAGAQVFDGPHGRRGGRAGARRRLRVPHALRPRRRHAGELHRARGGRRRAAARRAAAARNSRCAPRQTRRAGRCRRSCRSTSRPWRWPKSDGAREHARELGYLRPTDRIVMNRFELLDDREGGAARACRGRLPPAAAGRRRFPCRGAAAIATIKAFMVNMLEGGHISEHDYLIGSKVATVMCGGDVEGGSLVDEQWILDLERAALHGADRHREDPGAHRAHVEDWESR